jgi:predicted Zn-dependent peptidase
VIADAMLVHRDVELPSGLRLVLVQREEVHRAVASLYLRVGSRFESREQNGISHFLEHMVFRGTPTMPTAHAQALAFERLGTTLYAATHVDHGLLSVNVPPPNLPAVLQLFGEVVRAPRFSAIEVERGIVREEILEDLDEDGRDIDADNIARAVMFDSHALGYPITGTLETLDRFDEASLRAHHARHYTAENALLCLAGRLGDLDACVRNVEAAFDGLPRGNKVTTSPPASEQRKARLRFVDNPGSQTDLRIAFRAPSEQDGREPATEMLLRMLDDGMSTRLYETICDRLGLCYDVSASYEVYEDGGVLDIAAGVHHDRAVTVVREIFGLLRKLADDGPTEDELTKAKQRHAWSVDAILDDPEEMAGFHGLAALAGIARTPAARHAELERVSAHDVREAARAVFRPENLTVVAVGLLSSVERQRLERLVKSFG